MDSVCEGGARAAIAPTHVEHGERRSAHGAAAKRRVLCAEKSCFLTCPEKSSPVPGTVQSFM